MEELAIFRIFASFPLVGLLLPDLSSMFMSPRRGIPFSHLYIEFFLLVGVFICTAGIWHGQRQQKTNYIKMT
jgi:hypothetical protein